MIDARTQIKPITTVVLAGRMVAVPRWAEADVAEAIFVVANRADQIALEIVAAAKNACFVVGTDDGKVVWSMLASDHAVAVVLMETDRQTPAVGDSVQRNGLVARAVLAMTIDPVPWPVVHCAARQGIAVERPISVQARALANQLETQQSWSPDREFHQLSV
jgi:hypothetical protein